MEAGFSRASMVASQAAAQCTAQPTTATAAHARGGWTLNCLPATHRAHRDSGQWTQCSRSRDASRKRTRQRRHGRGHLGRRVSAQGQAMAAGKDAVAGGRSPGCAGAAGGAGAAAIVRAGGAGRGAGLQHRAPAAGRRAAPVHAAGPAPGAVRSADRCRPHFAGLAGPLHAAPGAGPAAGRHGRDRDRRRTGRLHAEGTRQGAVAGSRCCAGHGAGHGPGTRWRYHGGFGLLCGLARVAGQGAERARDAAVHLRGHTPAHRGPGPGLRGRRDAADHGRDGGLRGLGRPGRHGQQLLRAGLPDQQCPDRRSGGGRLQPGHLRPQHGHVRQRAGDPRRGRPVQRQWRARRLHQPGEKAPHGTAAGAGLGLGGQLEPAPCRT